MPEPVPLKRAKIQQTFSAASASITSFRFSTREPQGGTTPMSAPNSRNPPLSVAVAAVAGGVYLGGGIDPRIADVLAAGRFRATFEEMGR